jgi:hypothetical protein
VEGGCGSGGCSVRDGAALMTFGAWVAVGGGFLRSGGGVFVVRSGGWC